MTAMFTSSAFASSATAFRRLCSVFCRDQSGATAIEYALIASGISIAIAAALVSLGTSVKNDYTSVATALK
jgi:pilus assembly protein Flp/PilA